jgi:hypothetical protein
VVNLIVAKGISRHAELDIRPYQEQVNAWAYDFQSRWLPYWESYFPNDAECFRNDIRFFRLGMLANYLDQIIGITYKDDQRDAIRIRYLNPDDLFLNGVLDTLQGTCGNMAALHVAIGWRMGWAVSMACINSHYIVRYDDGEVIHNVEATFTGGGGFSSKFDHNYIKERGLSQRALTCGSDLRALTPHERLGVFVGLRARHYRDLSIETCDRNQLRFAEREYLLARYLFPAHRLHNRELVFATAVMGAERFESIELGHPDSYLQLLNELEEFADGRDPIHEPMPPVAQSGDSRCTRRRLSETALEILESTS